MKVFCLLFFGLLGAAAATDKVVCYFSSWARYRPSYGMFDVDDIDPFLCTHLMFSFTGLSNHTWEIEVLDPWNELCPEEQGGHYCAFQRFVALKDINPDLKTIVAIGGWNEGSEDYSTMARDPVKRQTFVDSTLRLIEKYGFDGLDFDWEYPAARGGAPEDKANFVTVCEMLREEFDRRSPPLLLTGAFAAGYDTVDVAYDIPKLVNLFDIFNVMAYDYHGAFENFTHHNAPLCGHPLDQYRFPYYNVMYTLQYYLDLGVPKEKITLGTATYGRCYVLDDPNQHGFFAPANNPGPPGPYIRLPGTLGFNEMCERHIQDPTCTIVHDPVMYEPYFYCTSDNIWCSYDDEDSLRIKARQAKNLGLGGLMVWQIDTDDFYPRCYGESFHLIKTMKRAFSESAGSDFIQCNWWPQLSSTTTSTPTTTTTTTTTTPTTTTTTTPTTTTPTTTTPTTTTPTTTTPTTTTPTTTTTTTTPTTTTPTTTTPTTTTPTTTTPTTTTTTTTTTTPTTTTTTTTPTTTTPTTAIPTTSSDGINYSRPDCGNHLDGTTFRHYDCDKYWECVNGNAILMACGPGTLYDENMKICNWEGQVDQTKCRTWPCNLDNTYSPATNCNQYYRCYNGARYLETCPSGEYWNQVLTICDFPSRVDTSSCNRV